MSAHRLHDVAILNRSTVASDNEVQAIVTALQEQVLHHFSPVWGIGAHVSFIPKQQLTGWEGKWNLIVGDTSDEAGALGYHSLTPEGLPVGFAFAKTDKLYGAKLSVTLSHELLEMLLDPYISLCAEDSDRGYFVAYEACDAVEADELGYPVKGVVVSDFVTPAFFDPTASSHKLFSYRKNVHGPFNLAPGGYEAVFIPGQGWTQNTARTPQSSDLPLVGSRRERRMRGKAAWQRSVP